MKQGIHPHWNNQAQVSCACGNKFKTGATTKVLEVDICAKCHPFFTGEMKFVDRQGRVDKFKKKIAAAKAAKKKTGKKQTQPVVKKDPKTYKELLREQRSQLRQANRQ
jgi:large subunit ribosomal protein L31